MAQEVVGSILLACRSGRSNKEYLIEVLEDFDQNTAKQMVARYGPSGRLGGLKEYGSYSSNDANKLIESKLKKGYQIERVNGKPFTSGNYVEAIHLMNGQMRWGDISTAQPDLKFKPREVNVTFTVGQVAPVW
jgi:PDZ domain-containing secreted protein